MKNIYFIIVALFLLFYVIHIVRKGKLSIKESFWWVIGALIALVLAIFPKSIDVIAKWFGVSYPPTLMFVFCILFFHLYLFLLLTLFLLFYCNQLYQIYIMYLGSLILLIF